MLAVDYLKKRLLCIAAIALGQRLHVTSNVTVSVKSNGYSALLEAEMTQVTYEAFGERHVNVVIKILDNDRNVDRVIRSNLKLALLGKVYRHTDDTTYSRQYHTLRFAEQLSK